jgi:hypothetical protein
MSLPHAQEQRDRNEREVFEKQVQKRAEKLAQGFNLRVSIPRYTRDEAVPDAPHDVPTFAPKSDEPHAESVATHSIFQSEHTALSAEIETEATKLVNYAISKTKRKMARFSDLERPHQEAPLPEEPRQQAAYAEFCRKRHLGRMERIAREADA